MSLRDVPLPLPRRSAPVIAAVLLAASALSSAAPGRCALLFEEPPAEETSPATPAKPGVPACGALSVGKRNVMDVIPWLS